MAARPFGIRTNTRLGLGPTALVDTRRFRAVVLDRIHAAGIALPDVDDLADPFTAVAKSLNALSRPVLLVLIRPDLISEPELDDQLIELLALCHNLDLVVTLSGFGMFAEPYLLDTAHEVIGADELLFTTADTAQLLEQAGVHTAEGDAEPNHIPDGWAARVGSRRSPRCPELTRQQP